MTDSEKAAAVKRLVSRVLEVIAAEDPNAEAPHVLAQTLGSLVGIVDTTFKANGKFFAEVVTVATIAMSAQR